VRDREKATCCSGARLLKALRIARIPWSLEGVFCARGHASQGSLAPALEATPGTRQCGHTRWQWGEARLRRAARAPQNRMTYSMTPALQISAFLPSYVRLLEMTSGAAAAESASSQGGVSSAAQSSLQTLERHLRGCEGKRGQTLASCKGPWWSLPRVNTCQLRHARFGAHTAQVVCFLGLMDILLRV